MKKSTNRFSTQRWDNFAADINTQEDDFLLADLQTAPDDTGLTMTPLNHIIDDEDAIDRLLANSGFDADNNTVPATSQPDAFAASKTTIDAVNVVDHVGYPTTRATVYEQNNTAFVVEPLPEDRLQSGQTEAIIPTDFRVDKFISDYLALRQPESLGGSDPEIDAADMASSDETVLLVEPIILESPQRKPDHGADALIDDAKWGAPDSSTVIPEHKANVDHDASVLQLLQTNQAYLEKQLTHLQKRSSTVTRLAYAGLIFGIAVLMSNAALFTMIADLKTDVSKLAEWVEMLKEGLEAAQPETPVEH